MRRVNGTRLECRCEFVCQQECGGGRSKPRSHRVIRRRMLPKLAIVIVTQQ